MSFISSNSKEKAGNRLSEFSGPIRVAILAGAVVILGIVLFWLFNELFYYLVAKSYADELSEAYNLNKGFTKALIWASFSAVVFFAGCTFSFSKRKRAVGYLGILVLLIGHGVLMGVRDPNYGPTGKTEKCYVLKRDGITILNHAGVDPDSGRECKVLTPQMAEKYNAYKDGRRPQVVTGSNPTFFDPVSGEPIVWFAKDSAGHISLFDLMGFHPQTGEELKPVDKAIVDEWRNQSSKVVRRAPNRVLDPNTYGFFDPVTGSPKIWFWASDAGEYEFFDGPGFHPTSGDALKPINKDVIAKWKEAVQAANDKARKEHELRDQTTAKNVPEQQPNDEVQRQLSRPSFDCSKASYADEHAICDNTELSQLDRVVVAAFESVRRLHGDQYARASISAFAVSTLVQFRRDLHQKYAAFIHQKVSSKRSAAW